MKIFISYSRKDADFAYALATALKRDFSVWIDTQLLPGDQWWQEIVVGIQECDCFIALLSPHSLESIFCKAERDYAIALGMTFLPVILQHCDLTEYEPTQWIDLRSFSKTPIPTRLERLIPQLKKLDDDVVRQRKKMQKDATPPARPLAVDLTFAWQAYEMSEWAISTNNLHLARELLTEIINIPSLTPTLHDNVSRSLRTVFQRQAYREIVEQLQSWTTLGNVSEKLQEYLNHYGDEYDPYGYLTDNNLGEFPVTSDQYQLIRIIQNQEATVKERIVAAEHLVTFNDPRPGTGTNLEGVPDILWMPLPLVSNGKQLQISKYPVTNKQFDAFVGSKPHDYHSSRWWKDLRKPSSPHAGRWTIGNYPRENVNWYEAIAFCRWLSVKLKCDISLPSIEEWQLAAGASSFSVEGGIYQSGCANVDETYDGSGDLNLGHVVSVGSYPQNKSNYGIVDLCGNIWEWTLDETTNGMNLLCGGSWRDGVPFAKSDYTLSLKPETRRDNVGFRIARYIEV